MGLTVELILGVLVGRSVGFLVGSRVTVGVGVKVGVGVFVEVGVDEGVGATVGAGLGVGVEVCKGVGVGQGNCTMPALLAALEDEVNRTKLPVPSVVLPIDWLSSGAQRLPSTPYAISSI